MYRISIERHFDAAHYLREYEGKCENLHGHNWKIEVCVTSETLDATGLAIDFGILKKHVNGVVDMLDHKFLNDLEPFKHQNPSSENIARYVADKLALSLQEQAIRVSRVTAWESETACATYYASPRLS